MLLLAISLLLILLFYILINYFKALTYWKNKEIKFIKPLPIFGNSLPTVLKTIAFKDFVVNLYKAFPNERYCGIFQFGQPILLLRDPELIKKVTISKFDSFRDHAVIFSSEVDPLWANNLFAVTGEKWKNLRQTLSPVFTSGKMKNMFVLMDECANEFIDFLKSHKEEVIEFEMKEIIRRFTSDVIATTAFGVKCNSLTDKDNEFLRMGAELTDSSGLTRLKFVMYNFNQQVLKILNIKMINDKVSNFFRGIIKDILENRSNNHIIRPDLIHLLMEARKGQLNYDEETNADLSNTGFATVQESSLGIRRKQVKQELTDDEITSQAIIFFFGGFDTTSMLITFAIYELVANPNIQEKLKNEVNITLMKNNGKISYTALFSMKYMDMVISEVLRKWPPAYFIDRRSNTPFTIEPENKTEKPLYLEKGTIIWIPIYAIHWDSKYYPNPDVFDPERFNDENKNKIDPSTYIPFGSGPRNCIGSRYALMVAKLLLFHILAKFEIVKTDKSRIPLTISKDVLFLTPQHGFWFGFKKRNF